MKIICATGNNFKFGLARESMAEYDIELIQSPVDIDEIQGEVAEVVIKDKAHKAFEALDAPVVVTDDWWDIPALGGFPGAYMKSINSWFAPGDFIDLMSNKSDRRIVLHQNICYYDGLTYAFFSDDLEGRVTDKPRGISGPPAHKVIEMSYDSGQTISEVYDASKNLEQHRIDAHKITWQKLANYLRETKS